MDNVLESIRRELKKYVYCDVKDCPGTSCIVCESGRVKAADVVRLLETHTKEHNKSMMCDQFCKWPDIEGHEDDLYKHCDDCPLNRL